MPQIGFMPNFAVSAKTQMEKRGQMSDRTPLNTRRTIVHVRWAFHEPPPDGSRAFLLTSLGDMSRLPAKAWHNQRPSGPKTLSGVVCTSKTIPQARGACDEDKLRGSRGLCRGVLAARRGLVWLAVRPALDGAGKHDRRAGPEHEFRAALHRHVPS